MWMDFEKCREAVEKGTLKNCIYKDELELLRKELFQ